jgi:hypothetical protein
MELRTSKGYGHVAPYSPRGGGVPVGVPPDTVGVVHEHY